MRSLRPWISTLAVLVLAGVARAAEPGFQITTDKPDAMYQPGEKMTFSLVFLEDGKPAAGRELRWQRRGDDGKEEKGTLTSAAEPVTITTSLEQPGFVRLTVTPLDENHKPYKFSSGYEKGKDFHFECGAGVQPEKLTTVPEPENFDAFWQEQKKKLAEVPLKAEQKPIEVKNPKLVGFDVQIDCAGGKPVSGYFTKPKDAAPKSLPATVSFHGYGVRGANIPNVENMLALDINAHGIANGQPKEYYEALQKGELANYGFKNNDSPETSYFLGMFLRLMRALEFMKAQPEWDGKNLIVTGGSQGGLQSLAAAGLDPQVTFCLVNKPWCCDLGGITLGRQRGWRPDYTPAMGYFDAANHAKRIKGFVLVDSGLGDYVCPPSGITAMFNNIPGEAKQLIYMQGTTHSFNQPGVKSAWNEYGACLAKTLKK